MDYPSFKVGDPQRGFEQEKGELSEFQSLQYFRQLEERVASLSVVYRYWLSCKIFPISDIVTGNFSSDENISLLEVVLLQHFILAKKFLMSFFAHLITPMKPLSLCDPQRLWVPTLSSDSYLTFSFNSTWSHSKWCSVYNNVLKLFKSIWWNIVNNSY